MPPDTTIPRAVLVHPKDVSGIITKGGPLVLDLLDDHSGIDLETFILRIRVGVSEPWVEIVGEGLLFADGWDVLFENLTPGSYRVYVYPDRFTTWRDGDSVLVTANVQDHSANVAEQASWEFTASDKPFSFETFRFIQGSIREIDGEVPPPQIVGEPEPEPEEEYEEMQSPQINWTDADNVAVELPPLALGQEQTFRLQDGQRYPFSGGESIDFDASGVNGIDLGARTNSTWYYLYLVPVGGVLKAIASARDPENILGGGAGPSGFTSFLPIGAVYNDSTGAILEFKCDGSVIIFTHFQLEVNNTTADGAAVQLDLTYIPVTASTALLWTQLQISGSGYGETRIWVDGAVGQGNNSFALYRASVSTGHWMHGESFFARVPMGDTVRRIHYQKWIGSGTIATGAIKTNGWVDKFRV